MTPRRQEPVRRAEPLLRRDGNPELYRGEGVERLGPHIEERGTRSNEDVPSRVVGVSNTGGLVPFKGAVRSDTSRYRRVDAGDFVYTR